VFYLNFNLLFLFLVYAFPCTNNGSVKINACVCVMMRGRRDGIVGDIVGDIVRDGIFNLDA